MTLGRVIGRVIATHKDAGLSAQKLLLVRPVDGEGKASGRALVMLDAVGAGAGELVFFARGREASFAFLPAEVPADATITGIVDHLHLRGRDRPGVTEV